MYIRHILVVAAFAVGGVSSAIAQETPITRDEIRKMIREIVREELQALPKKDAAAIGAAPSAGTAAETGSVEEIVQAEVGKQLAEQGPPKSIQAGQFEVKFEGYGDIQYAHHDYSENGFPEEGSRGASRSEFDLTRFVLELEAKHEESGLEFEAETEFEHGGTGSTVELEYDEFGEFEREVEKGGEIVLEELFVRKNFSDGWSARAGRFYVAVGLLSDYHLPTDYLASGRPEMETTILPGVWDEIGFEVQKQFENSRFQLQLVNGLDSTGFSASQWVASGKQDRFEVNRAQDIAVVTRADFTPLSGLLLGASGYFAGSTTDNRQKADLPDADGGVVIGDVHARYWGSDFRAQGSVVYGHLSDADEISERNSRLSNELGVERTAVADGAVGVWTEAGYNIAPMFDVDLKHRVDPFVRFDYYDTYSDTRANLADNKRYERSVYTAGVAYTYDGFFTTKLDYSIREFGQSDLSTQNTLRLGLGFVY